MKKEISLIPVLTKQEIIDRYNQHEKICFINKNLKNGEIKIKIRCDFIAKVSPDGIFSEKNGKDLTHPDIHFGSYILFDKQNLQLPIFSLNYNSFGKSYNIIFDSTQLKKRELVESHEIYDINGKRKSLSFPKNVTLTKPLSKQEIIIKQQNKEKMCHTDFYSGCIKCGYVLDISPSMYKFESSGESFYKQNHLYDINILTQDQIVLQDRFKNKARGNFTTTLIVHPQEFTKYEYDSFVSYCDSTYLVHNHQTTEDKYGASVSDFYKKNPLPTTIPTSEYAKIYDTETTALKTYIHDLKIKNPETKLCEIVVPYSQIIFENITYPQATHIALNKTAQSKHEISFQYDIKTGKLISPIVMGCETSVSAVSEFLINKNIKQIGDFHTHPPINYDVCKFSIGDFQMIAKTAYAELQAGCFDINNNHTPTILTIKKKDIPSPILRKLKQSKYVDYNTSVSKEFDPKLTELQNELNTHHITKTIFNSK